MYNSYIISNKLQTYGILWLNEGPWGWVKGVVKFKDGAIYRSYFFIIVQLLSVIIDHFMLVHPSTYYFDRWYFHGQKAISKCDKWYCYGRQTYDTTWRHRPSVMTSCNLWQAASPVLINGPIFILFVANCSWILLLCISSAA